MVAAILSAAACAAAQAKSWRGRMLALLSPGSAASAGVSAAYSRYLLMYCTTPSGTRY